MNRNEAKCIGHEQAKGDNPRCEACGGINCNCIMVWNEKLKHWFPIQRTEIWFATLPHLPGRSTAE